MQAHAYDSMKQMQVRHWWWRGMQRLYRTALARFLTGSPQCPRYVVDIGCGFGANLTILNPLGNVVGVDISLEVLLAMTNCPSLGLVQARADALPFRAGTFDVVALLAVIEHTDHDNAVLAETHRVARQGAIQLLLTSAFMLLWSHHDQANAHRRRYRAGQIERLQCEAGWQSLVTSYVNATVFPVVAFLRVVQRHMKSGRNGTSEYDMGPDIIPVNRFLEACLAAEAWLVIHGIQLPFGVDLFSIARRDDSV